MTESDLILIEQYLDGTMDESVRKEFIERLKEDSQLKAQLQMVTGVRKAINIDSEGFLKALSGAAEDYDFKEERNPKKANRRIVPIIGIAAGLFLLIFAGYVFRENIFGSPSPQKMFAKNFERYPNNVTVRGGLISDKTLQEKALYFYMRSLDEEAIVMFKALISNGGSDTIHFFCGVSYLSIPEPESAIEQFEEVAKYKDSAYEVPSKWYLALAYLKMEAIEQSKEILKDLSSQTEDPSYANKANELLEKLE